MMLIDQLPPAIVLCHRYHGSIQLDLNLSSQVCGNGVHCGNTYPAFGHPFLIRQSACFDHLHVPFPKSIPGSAPIQSFLLLQEKRTRPNLTRMNEIRKAFIIGLQSLSCDEKRLRMISDEHKGFCGGSATGNWLRKGDKNSTG